MHPRFVQKCLHRRSLSCMPTRLLRRSILRHLLQGLPARLLLRHRRTIHLHILPDWLVQRPNQHHVMQDLRSKFGAKVFSCCTRSAPLVVGCFINIIIYFLFSPSPDTTPTPPAHPSVSVAHPVKRSPTMVVPTCTTTRTTARSAACCRSTLLLVNPIATCA